LHLGWLWGQQTRADLPGKADQHQIIIRMLISSVSCAEQLLSMHICAGQAS